MKKRKADVSCVEGLIFVNMGLIVHGVYLAKAVAYANTKPCAVVVNNVEAVKFVNM